MNLLSRSVVVMFLFDLLTLLISTTFWYTYFGLPMMFIEIIVFLTVLTGLATLFLKDNYKIREFNITHKNTYLLFEGMVFTHIPTAVALLFITNWMQESAFILANLITTFFALRVYRATFHFYLFNIKKTKNILINGQSKLKCWTPKLNNFNFALN